jgi:hypothetical protein
MKKTFCGVLALTLVAACSPRQSELDGKALAEQFMRAGGEKPVGAVVFTESGEAIVVAADGKIPEPCRFPAEDGKSVDSNLPECHGTKDTTVYGMSSINVLRHKGSNCMIFQTFIPSTGQWINRQICVPPI